MALDHEQTQGLLRQYAALAAQHGAAAPEAVAVRNRLVEGHLGLVYRIWGQCFRNRIALDDVLGIGAQGLVMAIERFDCARGLRFSTYATPWIRYALGRTHANEGGVVRVPVHAQSSRYAGKCAPAAQAARHLWSLDRPINEEGGATFGDSCADPVATEAFDQLDHQDMLAAMRAAMRQLPTPERTVLEARMADRTLADVGAQLGCSREHIRQLEQQALGRLRRALAA